MSSSSTPAGLEPLELEELHPRPSDQAQRQAMNRRPNARSSSWRHHPIDQVWALIRLYLEGHPFVATVLLFGAIGVLLHLMVSALRRPLTRHRISHDYTKINYDYNFRASQMQHWCLFGDDDACTCEDFTEPVPRMERKGWREAHEANQALAASKKEYDVVFLGDDTTEMWNGRALNVPAMVHPNGRAINQYFNHTFTKAGGGQIEGLALGIYGDSTANLLWRLQNGEFPPSLHSKIWWVLIGSNDLAQGGCSEEATELGILRIAEEIHYHRPLDVIVLQGILPRSVRPDGAISEKAGLSLFGHSKKEYSVKTAMKEFVLWPSIVNINKQIEEFCGKHEHTVYFDVSHLFLGTIGNEFYNTKRSEIIQELMPDYAHPSAEGMTVMGDAIVREVIRIIYDEDENNDIET